MKFRMDNLEEESEDDTGIVLKYHEKRMYLKINVYKNIHLIYFSCIKINKISLFTTHENNDLVQYDKKSSTYGFTIEQLMNE